MKDDPKKELNALSPLLSNLKEQVRSGDVPEGYFDTLADEVLAKARQGGRHDIPGGRVRRLHFGYLRFAAVAAALALAVAAGWWIFRPDAPTSETATASLDISPEEAKTFIAQNLDQFDLGMLAEVAPVEPFDEAGYKESTQIEPSLEDYLNDMDIEELEELF